MVVNIHASMLLCEALAIIEAAAQKKGYIWWDAQRQSSRPSGPQHEHQVSASGKVLLFGSLPTNESFSLIKW